MDFQGYSIVAFGTNGTGKTTTCKKWANAMYQKGLVNGVLCLIPDDDEEAFGKIKEIGHKHIPAIKKGWFKLVVDDPDATFEKIFYELPPNFIVFVDDVGAIMDPRNPYVMKFMKRRRQKQAHVLANCHGAMDFPRNLFKNVTEFWIFQTTDSYKTITDRIQDPKHFGKAVEYVKERAKENPHFFLRYRLADPPPIK